MADKVKVYEVLEDQKYTGKHNIYVEGQRFPESELFGNKESIAIAIDGQKSVRAKNKEGKDMGYNSLNAKKPKIKLVTGTKKADSK